MKNTSGPRLRAVALLLLVAGFGFFMGIIADRLVLGRVAAAAEAGPGSPRLGVILRSDEGGSPRPPGRRVIRLGPPQELVEELDLTPEQRVELERILADDQAAIRRITSQLEPSIRDIIEGSRQKIEKVLTEEQMERWDELSVRRRRVFHEEVEHD